MILLRKEGVAATLGLTCALAGAVAFATRPSAKADKGTAKPAGSVPHKKGALTFTKDIAPILLQNCASCHRPGEIGPFPLLSYQDAKKRAAQLVAVTESRYMPPWHADSHGEFLDERKLSADQIGMLKQWADEGAVEGRPADMPKIPAFPEGWILGKPDMILEPTRSYTLGAEGADVYRCFVLPTHLAENRYLASMEVRPGNSKVVHHVIAYLDSSGKARELEAANKDGGPGYSVSGGGIGVRPTGAIGGWAPGNLPRRLPEGVGTLVPRGTDVVLQVHYHKSGKPETDQTKIGLYFCKAPVDKRLRVLPIVYPFLQIPAGEPNYTVKGFPMPVTEAATVLEVMPHMHLLGKEMTVSATLPDKTEKTLVRVPNYDFNWQTTYMYKEPVKLPQGAQLGLTARYDNSDKNPRNPSRPPREVHWGEQTTDEMCIAFVYYTLDREQLTKGIEVHDFLDKLGGLKRGRAGGGGLLKRRDQAGEGGTP
jgi:mono/diheme cytochrome c family protein